MYICDNDNLPPNDRILKRRTLISQMQNTPLKYSLAEPELSIDESMIDYFGRHGCIKGKPIRFGFEVWSLATRSGYCVNLEQHP